MDWLLIIRILASAVALIFFFLDMIESKRATDYRPYVFIALLIRQIIALLIRLDMVNTFLLSKFERDFLVMMGELAICFTAIRFWHILRAR